MRLKVFDNSEKLTTVLDVKCVEYPEGESYFRVWDGLDNAADILTESPLVAEKTVNQLFEQSRAEVNATFYWCDHDI